MISELKMNEDMFSLGGVDVIVIRCYVWCSSGYDAYLDSKRPRFDPPLRHRTFLIIRCTVIISYTDGLDRFLQVGHVNQID